MMVSSLRRIKAARSAAYMCTIIVLTHEAYPHDSRVTYCIKPRNYDFSETNKKVWIIQKGSKENDFVDLKAVNRSSECNECFDSLEYGGKFYEFDAFKSLVGANITFEKDYKSYYFALKRNGTIKIVRKDRALGIKIFDLESMTKHQLNMVEIEMDGGCNK